MAMLFVDESGHFADSKYLSLAGYISTDAGWSALSADWSILLEKYSLPGIHMKQIMSSKGNSPAASWDMPKKLEMLAEFILVIRKYVQAGFGVGMDAGHYRSVVESIKRTAKEQGVSLRPFKPKAFCVARLLSRIMSYCDDLKILDPSIIIDPVSLIFDDDRAYAMECYSCVRDVKDADSEVRKRIVSIGFADDEWFYPLQAADILAYATCNELKKRPDDRWKDGNIFTELLRTRDPAYGILYKSEFWDEEPTRDETLRALIWSMLNR